MQNKVKRFFLNTVYCIDYTISLCKCPKPGDSCLVSFCGSFLISAYDRRIVVTCDCRFSETAINVPSVAILLNIRGIGFGSWRIL